MKINKVSNSISILLYINLISLEDFCLNNGHFKIQMASGRLKSEPPCTYRREIGTLIAFTVCKFLPTIYRLELSPSLWQLPSCSCKDLRPRLHYDATAIAP